MFLRINTDMFPFSIMYVFLSYKLPESMTAAKICLIFLSFAVALVQSNETPDNQVLMETSYDQFPAEIRYLPRSTFKWNRIYEVLDRARMNPLLHTQPLEKRLVIRRPHNFNFVTIDKSLAKRQAWRWQFLTQQHDERMIPKQVRF